MSVEEKLNQANGAIKEGVGKVTDDKKTEKEGLYNALDVGSIWLLRALEEKKS